MCAGGGSGGGAGNFGGHLRILHTIPSNLQNLAQGLLPSSMPLDKARSTPHSIQYTLNICLLFLPLHFPPSWAVSFPGTETKPWSSWYPQHLQQHPAQYIFAA